MTTWTEWAEATLSAVQALADSKLAEAGSSGSTSGTSSSTTTTTVAASPVVEAAELISAAANLKSAIDLNAMRILSETTGIKITTAQFEATPGEAGKMQRAMMVLPMLKDAAKLKEIQAEMSNPTKII